jgi:hypothetical protein
MHLDMHPDLFISNLGIFSYTSRRYSTNLLSLFLVILFGANLGIYFHLTFLLLLFFCHVGHMPYLESRIRVHRSPGPVSGTEDDAEIN